jgi:serine/threonine-protein kinase
MGVILYRMFTGSVPFLADSLYDVMTAHVNQAPVPPRQLAQVPEELDRIILSCLAKDKAERPASVAALRETLLPLLGRLAEAGTETPAQLAAPPRVAVAVAATTAPPPATTPRGRRLALLVALLGAVGALGVGGVALWRSRVAVPAAPPSAAALARADAGAPRLVLIQFMVSPPDAPYSLRVDGRKLDRPEVEAPASRTRKLDIKVEAPGFQTVSIQTAPSSDMAIPINLVKVAEPAAKPDAARRPGKGTVKPARPDDPKPPPAVAPAKGPNLKLIDKL